MITITERRKIAKLVLTTNNDDILDKIKAMLSGAIMTRKNYIKKYNKEIDDAVLRIKKGHFYSQKDADELLQEWEKE